MVTIVYTAMTATIVKKTMGDVLPFLNTRKFKSISIISVHIIKDNNTFIYFQSEYLFDNSMDLEDLEVVCDSSDRVHYPDKENGRWKIEVKHSAIYRVG
jgi:hypothetical protein